MNRLPLAFGLTAVLLPAMALGACGDDTTLADGTLQVTVYGEDEIEDQLPGNDLEDGWTIDFSRFLVAIDHVSLAASGKSPALTAVESRVFDLAKPSNGLGHLLATSDAAGGVYDVLAYTIGPAGSGAIAGNVTASDVTAMVDGGFSLLIEGSASKAGVVKDFTWGFTSGTRYEPCEAAAKVDGATATAQITVHADHLFLDSLVDEGADLRFQAFADADGNSDGEVTLDELAQVSLASLTHYDVAAGSGITTLRAYLEAQVQTIGHVDGDGECEIAP